MTLREVFSDSVILGGCAAMTWGVYLYSPPAASIVGGVMLIAFGLLLGRTAPPAGE